LDWPSQREPAFEPHFSGEYPLRSPASTIGSPIAVMVARSNSCVPLSRRTAVTCSMSAAFEANRGSAFGALAAFGLGDFFASGFALVGGLRCPLRAELLWP